jgi:multidrug efflux pump subunit AcrA (membrane-fusion protein)
LAEDRYGADEVIAKSSVNLSNELAGRIKDVGFQPGAQVSKGQFLERFDIAEEIAQRDAAMVNATIAKLLLECNTTLAKTEVASAETLDNAKAQFNVASVRIAVLDAMTPKKTLLAPFDTSTGLHELKQSQYLPAGNVITRLVGIDTRIWVNFSLPQQQASLAMRTA